MIALFLKFGACQNALRKLIIIFTLKVVTSHAFQLFKLMTSNYIYLSLREAHTKSLEIKDILCQQGK